MVTLKHPIMLPTWNIICYLQVKNCINTFEEIASQPNVNFLGNVAVGYDVKIEDLLKRYHVVILAYGAGSGNIILIYAVYLSFCLI